MLVSALLGLSLFTLLLLVATHFEQQKAGVRLRLERLRTAKKGAPFSVGEMLGVGKPIAALGEKLNMAGRGDDPEDLLLGFVLINVLGMALGVYYGYILLATLLPVATVFVGGYLLDTMASQRTRVLEGQFRDFMKSLSLHLTVVPAFQTAFVRAAEKMENPLKSYLDRVVMKLQSGESIETALKVLKQLPSTQISSWVGCTLFAVRIKSNLSRMCGRTATRLFLKHKMANRVSAQTTQSKSLMVSMGGIMLFMMVSTMASSQEFVEFYTSPLGRTVASLAILSFVTATLYVLRKIDREMAK